MTWLAAKAVCVWVHLGQEEFYRKASWAGAEAETPVALHSRNVDFHMHYSEPNPLGVRQRHYPNKESERLPEIRTGTITIQIYLPVNWMSVINSTKAQVDREYNQSLAVEKMLKSGLKENTVLKWSYVMIAISNKIT